MKTDNETLKLIRSKSGEEITKAFVAWCRDQEVNNFNSMYILSLTTTIDNVKYAEQVKTEKLRAVLEEVDERLTTWFHEYETDDEQLGELRDTIQSALEDE